MPDILLIIAGGGLGSAGRYLVSAAATRAFGTGFAWGTLAVNLAGCLLIGVVVGLVDRAAASRALHYLLVTGFLGGFTTFSSFSLESVRMLADGEPGKALANIGVNVALGMALTFAGLAAVQRHL